MSIRQRFGPLIVASAFGVVSGYYIFSPSLKQYAIDSRGTFDPKVAQAGAAGGIGGGVNDARKVGSASDPAQHPKDKDSLAYISGEDARRRLKEALADPRSQMKESDIGQGPPSEGAAAALSGKTW